MEVKISLVEKENWPRNSINLSPRGDGLCAGRCAYSVGGDRCRPRWGAAPTADVCSLEGVHGCVGSVSRASQEAARAAPPEAWRNISLQEMAFGLA